MNIFPAHNSPVILGTRGLWPLRLPFRLKEKQRKAHKRIMGISGMGKSYLLAQYASDLIAQGIPTSLIDPHSDLAHDTLRLLYESGYLHRDGTYKKFWYIDFARTDRCVPFNVLKQSSYPLYTVARNVQEAFFRAFPALAGGIAPVFQNVLQYSVIALAQNNLPLTRASKLLAPGNRGYREQLLKNVSHQPTIDFFHDRFDHWKDQADKVESTLNKVDIFSFSDHLRFALCQQENLLDFRRIIDDGISVIFNLGGATVDEETQRLIGCLLTVGFEQAALSRGDLPKDKRREYHLIIDEFASFSTANGETYAKLLSQARKFQFFLTLAHQTLEQLPEGLQTAVQNMAVEIYFGLGYSDSQVVAPRVGRFNPLEVKHEVADETQKERTHPTFLNLPEQWEQQARDLENQWEREAYVKLRRHVPHLLQHFMKPYKTVKIRTRTVPRQRVRDSELQGVKDYYAKSLLRSKDEIEYETRLQEKPMERRSVQEE